MGRPRHFTDDDAQMMRGMRDLGLSLKEIAFVFKTSPGSVSHYIRDSHERINCAMQDHYVASKEYREAQRIGSMMRNTCVHFPEGQDQIPRGLLKRLRVHCLEMGGDPGFRPDLVMAGLDLYSILDPNSDEAIWLHPEDLEIRCNKWAKNWRRIVDHEKYLRKGA